MKITIITPAFPYPKRGEYYGIERYVENLALSLHKLGHKITVMTTFYNGGGRCDSFDGIKIKRLLDTKALFKEAGVIGFMHYFSFGLNLYRKTNFKYCANSDIVILNMPLPFTRIFKLKKIPVFSVFHHYVPCKNLQDYLTFPFYHYLEKSQFNINKNVVAISQKSKEALLKHYKLQEENITIIPDGINLERFNPSNYSSKIKEKYGKGKFLIFFSGLMVPRKRIPILLKAFQFVLKKRKDVHLLLSGEGPFFKHYKKLSNKFGIKNNTTFLGFINDKDLAKFYASSDIYILPSELEGFGQVILEAMASGTPVICADKPPMSKLIEAGGITFKLNNPKDLGRKILYLLNNKDLLSKLKDNALKLVKKYRWKNIARKYSSYCNQLLTSKKSFIT